MIGKQVVTFPLIVEADIEGGRGGSFGVLDPRGSFDLMLIGWFRAELLMTDI